MGEAMGLFLAEDGVPLRRARRFTRQVAGAELNVAVGLARLGHRCAFVGRVGDDPFGEDVVATLRAEGVDASAVVVDPDAPTGLLTRDAHGERAMRVVYHRSGSAGARLRPADLPDQLLDHARLLHLTGITPALGESARAAVEDALDRAAARGVAVSFDPNFRHRLWRREEAAPQLRELASRASVVLASEAEARWLSGREDPAAASVWLAEQGASVAVVKQGEAGALVTDGGPPVHVPALPLRAAVDPVGAGDAFDAGFLSAWLEGRPLAECARCGHAAGAACVMAAGDLDGLPTAAERDALLAGAGEVDR